MKVLSLLVSGEEGGQSGFITFPVGLALYVCLVVRVTYVRLALFPLQGLHLP